MIADIELHAVKIKAVLIRAEGQTLKAARTDGRRSPQAVVGFETVQQALDRICLAGVVDAACAGRAVARGQTFNLLAELFHADGQGAINLAGKVIETLWDKLTLLGAIADLTGRTVFVLKTFRLRHTLLRDADLTEGAVTVSHALNAAPADVVDADLAVIAVTVDATLKALRGLAEAQIALKSLIAVEIHVTLWVWNEEASPIETRLRRRTFGVACASSRVAADRVDALQALWTFAIIIAEEGYDAATSDTGKRARAVFI